MVPDILPSCSEPETLYRETMVVIDSSHTFPPISSRSQRTPSNLKTPMCRRNGTNMVHFSGHERINSYYRKNWQALAPWAVALQAQLDRLPEETLFPCSRLPNTILWNLAVFWNPVNLTERAGRYQAGSTYYCGVTPTCYSRT